MTRDGSRFRRLAVILRYRSCWYLEHCRCSTRQREVEMEREEMVRRARVAQQTNQEATGAMFAALSELKAVGDALGTDETGKALVDVARSAHKAELEYAELRKRYPAPECLTFKHLQKHVSTLEYIVKSRYTCVCDDSVGMAPCFDCALNEAAKDMLVVIKHYAKEGVPA